MNPAPSIRSKRLTAWCACWIGILLVSGTTVAPGKNIVMEGVIVDTDAAHSGDGTHLLLDGPHGRVLAVLQDLSRELRSQADSRHRLLGRLSRQVRSGDGLPVLEVLEVRSAGWSDPLDARAPGSAANWLGHGGSLHPSLDPEPLPVRHQLQLVSDRDGDGVPDNQDFFPDDPMESIDTDGDGIGNNADPDDDNDEVPDLYELVNDLNPLVRDALDDRDGDGMNNRAEWIAGTKANDALSVLRLKPLQYDAKKGVDVTWPSVVGRVYSVLFSNSSDDPKPGVSARITATETTTSVNLPAPDSPANGFFRLEVTQP